MIDNKYFFFPCTFYVIMLNSNIIKNFGRMCYVQEALYCKSRKRVSFYPVHLSLKKLIKNGIKIAISFLSFL